MRSYRWLLLGVLGCLAIMILAYAWAVGLMDPLDTYRSPLAQTRPGLAPTGSSVAVADTEQVYRLVLQENKQ